MIIFSTIIYLIFHLTIAESSIMTVILIMAIVLFYIYLKYTDISVSHVAYLLIFLFILNTVLTFDKLLHSIFSPSYLDWYKGLFLNPNTNGIFAANVLAATFLFIKNKKTRYIVSILFILYLLGCKSRNMLLFILSTFAFYQLYKTRFSRYAFLFFSLFICIILFYLIKIEPQMTAEIELFGKSGGSAGRSSQIIYIIKEFPLTLFGLGKDIPNNYSLATNGYAVHNFYINTIYGMGIIFLIIYFAFIKDIYNNLSSNIAKSFLLSFHIYFMFEPGMPFYALMQNGLPIILILLKYKQEKNEYYTLHL